MIGKLVVAAALAGIVLGFSANDDIATATLTVQTLTGGARPG